MKIGTVINVEHFEFLDGSLDEEQFQRKCLVLFSEIRDGIRYNCVCPIVSQINSFNKNPDNYYLLPITNDNGRKLYFAKLNSVVYLNNSDYRGTVGKVDLETMKRIVEKIKVKSLNFDNNEYYEEVTNKLENKITGVK